MYLAEDNGLDFFPRTLKMQKVNTQIGEARKNENLGPWLKLNEILNK